MDRKIKITSTTPYQEAFERFNEDGELETALTDYMIAAITEAGDVYLLTNVVFDDLDRAIAFAGRVAAAGEITESRWYYHRALYGSPAWEAANDAATPYRMALSAGWIGEDDVPRDLVEYL